MSTAKRSYRRWCAFASLGCVVALMASCAPRTGTAPAPAAGSGPAPDQPSPPSQLVTIKAGTLATVGDAGWWIGIDQGYFAREGIQLDYETFDSAAAMVAPLAAGQLEVGGGAISAGLFNAIARGVDIKAVADKSSSPPGHGTTGLVVRKELWDSGRVRSPADVRGMRIAFSGAGIAPETEVSAFLETGGVTLKELEVVNMSFADMVSALSNGSIDLAVPPEPFLTTIRNQDIGHIWVRSDEMLPGHITAVILYSPSFVRDKPELARRFMVAYLRAVRDYNDAFFKNDPAKRTVVVDALVKHTPLKDRAQYDQIVVQGLDPNGVVPLASLERDQQYFLSTGAQTQAIDLAKVVDPSYAEAAVRELGRYE